MSERTTSGKGFQLSAKPFPGLGSVLGLVILPSVPSKATSWLLFLVNVMI